MTRAPLSWLATVAAVRAVAGADAPLARHPVSDGGDDPAITRVDHDSRQVTPGSLFCCVPGELADGHDFAPAAVAAGAVALLVERPLPLPVPQLVVPDGRRAMAAAAVAVSHDPSADLTVIGVTGTNGKTTTTLILQAIFAAAGRRPAVLGTLSGPRTTPESPELQRWLAARRDDGADVVAMEVSSHTLALHRVDGTRFAAAVFTNLSRDHLDFHGSMEAYFEAKARLFTPELTDLAVVNLDDPHGRLLRDAATVRTVGYALDQVDDLALGAASSSFRWRGRPVRLRLGGRFNVANTLAAAETALALGVDLDAVVAGLGAEVAVPGRFEVIDEGQPFTVVVDFAHTPDALEQVLRAARELVAGQTVGQDAGAVTVVFGCGGDRDPSKRPAMGQVAAQLADRVVLTADNSRHEATRAIIDAVLHGTEHATDPIARDVTVEEEREAAIALALAGARPGDVVVIAGKGHETTQTIGDRITDFDDRVVARRILLGEGSVAS